VQRAVKHDFLFRRVVRCHGCGYNLIAERQKGHVYYRCHTQGCTPKTFREENLDSAVARCIAMLTLDEEERAYVRNWIANAQLEKENGRAAEMENCRQAIAQIRDRLGRLTDAYIDGVLERGMVEERRKGLLFEEAGLKQKLADLEEGRASALTRLEEFLELTKTASNLYNRALPNEKRDFVRKLTSNFGVRAEKIVITLTDGANEIANRRQVSSCALHRGVHRTWDNLLQRLLKQFEAASPREISPIRESKATA
jgi:hypothetical protein